MYASNPSASAEGLKKTILDPVRLAQIRALRQEQMPSVLGRVIKLYLDARPNRSRRCGPRCWQGMTPRLQGGARTQVRKRQLGRDGPGDVVKEFETRGREGRLKAPPQPWRPWSRASRGFAKPWRPCPRPGRSDDEDRSQWWRARRRESMLLANNPPSGRLHQAAVASLSLNSGSSRSYSAITCAPSRMIRLAASRVSKAMMTPVSDP